MLCSWTELNSFVCLLFDDVGVKLNKDYEIIGVLRGYDALICRAGMHVLFSSKPSI